MEIFPLRENRKVERGRKVVKETLIITLHKRGDTFGARMGISGFFRSLSAGNLATLTPPLRQKLATLTPL